MLYIVIGCVVLLAFIDRVVRKGRIERLEMTAAFQLYALRDRLRAAAIDGNTPVNNWFNYLDTSLSRTAGNIERVSIWTYYWYVVACKDIDPQVRQASHLRNLVFTRGEYRVMAEIFKEYEATIMGTLCARHHFLMFRHRRELKRATRPARRAVKKFSSIPVTSTLLQFAPGVATA